MANFDQAIAFVLKNEGGYSNHPDDKGGATNYGITQDVLKKWRGVPVTASDVRSMGIKEAHDIYRAKYWNPLNLDEVESQLVASVIFDQGVNRGIGTVAKQVQEIVGVAVDGKIGPKSLAAINSCQPINLAQKLVKASQISYCKIVQNNPSQRVFLVGWINRSHRLLDLLVAESHSRTLLHS